MPPHYTNNICLAILRTFLAVLQLRYFTANLTDMKRSRVIKKTVTCDTQQAVKSMASQQSHMKFPNGQ